MWRELHKPQEISAKLRKVDVTLTQEQTVADALVGG